MIYRLRWTELALLTCFATSSQEHQERRSRPRRRQPGQLDLRAGEWPRQEGQDREDHFVVDSRRCCAQARPRRTPAGGDRLGVGRFWASSRIIRGNSLLASPLLRALRHCRRALFFVYSQARCSAPSICTRLLPEAEGEWGPRVSGRRKGAPTKIQERIPPHQVPRFQIPREESPVACAGDSFCLR
jgi:hypothetical protein